MPSLFSSPPLVCFTGRLPALRVQVTRKGGSHCCLKCSSPKQQLCHMLGDHRGLCLRTGRSSKWFYSAPAEKCNAEKWGGVCGEAAGPLTLQETKCAVKQKVHGILYFHTAQCLSARLSQVLPHLISPQESQQHFREGKGGQGLGSKSPQQLVGVKDCNEHFSSSSSCPR